MTLWNKLVLGVKFLFGGFEPATDYLCNILNKYLAAGDIAERVQKARAYVANILWYLRKYKDYCPGKWMPYYEKLIEVVQKLVDIFEDNQVQPQEIADAIAAVKTAIAEWMED